VKGKGKRQSGRVTGERQRKGKGQEQSDRVTKAKGKDNQGQGNRGKAKE
jgi:hypothetical protein